MYAFSGHDDPPFVVRGAAHFVATRARFHGNSYYAMKKEISAQSGRFRPSRVYPRWGTEIKKGVGGRAGESTGRGIPGSWGELPTTDFVTIVGFAHLAQLIHIGPQGVAFGAGQMIGVEHMLNGSDRVAQIAFVEFSFVPLLGELAELLSRFIEPFPFVAGKLPDIVAMVQIHLNLIDQRVNLFRIVRSALRAILREADHTTHSANNC